MSSVVTELKTYSFTMIAASLLTTAGASCLVVCLFRRSESHRQYWTWATYDGLIAALALITVAALRRRLADMERATELLAMTTADHDYVDLTPASYMHVVCIDCASTLIAVALLKISIPWWPDVSVTGHSSLATAILIIVVSGYVASSRFAESMGTGIAVLILFNLVILVKQSRVPPQIL